jgi:transcriptional regulator with XRE-family HTH domain
METSAWIREISERIAAQVAAQRKALEWSAPDLVDACAVLGYPKLTRAIVSKIETGTRESVTIGELLVLAKALRIPPVSLVFPLTSGDVHQTPTTVTSAWEAAAWFTGETALDGVAALEGTPRGDLEDHRNHARGVEAALAGSRLATERRRLVASAEDTTEAEANAREFEQMAFQDCLDLRVLRDDMRRRGLTPPALPSEIAWVDGSRTGRAAR